MPMFDDPRQSLAQMQKELLDEEENEEYVTEEEWWEKEISEAKALIGMDMDEEEEVYHNYANGYGARSVQIRADYRDTEEEPEERPSDSVRGQLILTFLLTLGILSVAGYWAYIFLW